MPTALDLLQSAQSDPSVYLTGLLLPFMLVFVVVWGMLNLSKIFGDTPTGRKINMVVAVIIACFASISDAWGWIAGLAAGTGQFAYIMFFAVFILMIILWAINRSRDTWNSTRAGGFGGPANYNDVARINKDIAKFKKKMVEARNRGKMHEAEEHFETIEKLEKRRDALIAMKAH